MGGARTHYRFLTRRLARQVFSRLSSSSLLTNRRRPPRLTKRSRGVLSDSALLARDGAFIAHRFFLPRRNCGFAFSERWTFRQVMARQRLVGQTTAHDRIPDLLEPLGVRQAALVEPERLFVQIAEQVEWFNRNIRA